MLDSPLPEAHVRDPEASEPAAHFRSAESSCGVSAIWRRLHQQTRARVLEAVHAQRAGRLTDEETADFLAWVHETCVNESARLRRWGDTPR